MPVSARSVPGSTIGKDKLNQYCSAGKEDLALNDWKRILVEERKTCCSYAYRGIVDICIGYVTVLRDGKTRMCIDACMRLSFRPGFDNARPIVGGGRK